MNNLVNKYKKIIEDKPKLNTFINMSGVLIFAFLVMICCKVGFGGDKKSNDGILNIEEKSYYNANYKSAIREYQEKQTKEEWPIWIVKESEINSLMGDKVISNSLLQKAYRQRNSIIEKEGFAKHTKEDKALGNYIAFTYLMNGEVEKSIEYGEDFLSVNEENNNLRETLITAYINNGEKEKAKETLKKYKDEDNSYNLAKIAELNLLLDNYKESFRYLEKSFEKNNNDIKIFDVIEEAVLSNKTDFITMIKEKYETSKDDQMLKLFVAKISLMDKNGLEDCKKILNELNEETKKSVLYFSILVDINKKENNVDELKENISRMLELNNESYSAKYIGAEYYLGNNELNKAIELGKESIDLNVEYAKSYGLLFAEIIKNQNPDKVEAVAPYIRRGLYYEPYNCEIIEEAGKYYNEIQQNVDSAYNYYRLASSIEPYRAETYHEMAMISLKRDDSTEAIKSLSKAVDLDKDNDKYCNELGVIYFELGNSEKGIENIRKAYKLNNNNIKALNNAAVYYCINEKNLVKAIENIKPAYSNIENEKDILVKDTIKSNYEIIKKEYDIYGDRYNNVSIVADLKMIK